MCFRELWKGWWAIRILSTTKCSHFGFRIPVAAWIYKRDTSTLGGVVAFSISQPGLWSARPGAELRRQQRSYPWGPTGVGAKCHQGFERGMPKSLAENGEVATKCILSRQGDGQKDRKADWGVAAESREGGMLGAWCWGLEEGRLDLLRVDG